MSLSSSVLRSTLACAAASFLLLCGGLAPAHAQDAPDDGRAGSESNAQSESMGTERPPALRGSGWGLQFQFREFSKPLTGLQGSLISIRRHFSEKHALRAGVSLDASFDERDNSDEDPTGELQFNEDSDTQRYGASVQYLRYRQQAEDIFVYAGGGPRLRYAQQSQTESRSDSGREIQQETSAFTGALDGVVGVEWFVHPNISLSAEYGLAVEYDYREGTQRRIPEGSTQPISTRTDEETSFSVRDRSVTVGVTVSFGP